LGSPLEKESVMTWSPVGIRTLATQLLNWVRAGNAFRLAPVAPESPGVPLFSSLAIPPSSAFDSSG
jgi:hypothetical protein